MVLNSACPARHLVLLITHNNDRETKAARGGLAEAAGGGAGGQWIVGVSNLDSNVQQFIQYSEKAY